MIFKSDDATDINHLFTESQIEEMEDSLDALCQTIRRGKFCCASCRLQLPGDHADIYEHSGGWSLAAYVPKQWVSFACKCGYETSLNKMQRFL